LAFKVCYDFKRKSKDILSNITGTKVYYLQVLLWAFFSLNIFLLLASLFFDVLFVEYLLLPVSLIILHSSTVYYGFKNPAILSKDEFENNYSKNKDIIETIIPKSKATLTIDELSGLEEKIVNELKCNSIYKDTDISLAKMAQLLDIPTYKLSITINEKMNTTFYDLINSKRIDASLILLKDNNNFTIEAIALDVGFKSKSTFYRAFKKYKGTTPTNFISKT
jgi:AraC-like DNA-binding protein